MKKHAALFLIFIFAFCCNVPAQQLVLSNDKGDSVQLKPEKIVAIETDSDFYYGTGISISGSSLTFKRGRSNNKSDTTVVIPLNDIREVRYCKYGSPKSFRGWRATALMMGCLLGGIFAGVFMPSSWLEFPCMLGGFLMPSLIYEVKVVRYHIHPGKWRISTPA